MKKILFNIVRFFVGTFYVWIALISAIIVGLIWEDEIAVIATFFGICGIYVAFIMLRQIWWKITKTGDYEDNDKEG